MRLIKVTIKGYRSFKAETSIYLDDRITVLLGANDHGKTNFLSALEHLNPEKPFDGERDLNWDEDAYPDQFPIIKYTLKPDDDEKEAISGALTNKERVGHADAQLDTLYERQAEIEAEIQELEAALKEKESSEGNSAEQQEVQESDQTQQHEGDQQTSASETEASKLLKAKEAELSPVEEVIDNWQRAREVVSRIEGNEVSQETVAAAAATLKRRLAQSDVDLKKANEGKSAASKSLEKAKGSDDAANISQAERTLKQASDNVSRILSENAMLRRAQLRLEKHLEIAKSKSDKAYLNIIDQLTSISPKCPDTVEVVRKGVGGDLELLRGADTEPLPGFVARLLPKVQIFSSVDMT
ncbi:AAA family ATPase [Parvibaculum sp.]|uniref:AAA family ATPase n=1 Tax=Parvibaculum sp. TaxID=2024848 RepID=UPI001B246C41|nr:AAA family ATPase [Parvibaculum sp.]MBO6668799.1 AAA family ATPase [Parvibaculum sp.]MBO6691462.1 AAA family ATPase [Parvibaculum sp.]MBO6714476.1 AAA family ATPase [Parvibaculum sp.]